MLSTGVRKIKINTCWAVGEDANGSGKMGYTALNAHVGVPANVLNDLPNSIGEDANGSGKNGVKL